MVSMNKVFHWLWLLSGKLQSVLRTIVFLLILCPVFFLNSKSGEEERNEGYLPEPPEMYQRIPIADSAFIKHRGLPSKVDLEKYFPLPGKQGRQGSCVGWATTYALKSYHEKRKNNWDFGPHVQEEGGPGNHIFSPAWTYNQVNRGKDRGAHIPHALDLLIQKGAVTWDNWPYTPSDFRKQPTSEQKRRALKFRAKHYETIPIKNTEALKAELAKGFPMVIGVNSGPDRWNCCKNNRIYDGYTVRNKSGHAMVLIGYDDSKRSPKGHKGAFKIMDSDGKNWGTNGYGWVSYEFSKSFFYAAYALRDWEPGTTNIVTTKLQPPGNVRASQGSETDNILITWNKSSGALGYEILRSENEAVGFSNIGETASASYRDSSATAGKVYYYRIVAVNESDKSEEESSMTVSGFLGEQQVIGAVQGLKGELLPSGHILLTWETLANATLYKIMKEDISSGRKKQISNTGKTTYTDRNPMGGPNRYWVYALVKGKESLPSESITVEGKEGAPGQVINLQASEGVFADKIVLQWDKVPGAEKYWVVRFNAQINQWEEAGFVPKNQFIDSSPNISDGTKVAYSVRAISGIQAGPAAFPVRGYINKNVTRAGKPPLPPIKLTAQAKDKRVILKFAKTSDAKEYYIFRKYFKEKEYTFLTSVKKEIYSEPIPSEGKLIFYAVKSMGKNGVESTFSEPIGFSVPASYVIKKKRDLAPPVNPAKFSGRYSGAFYSEKGVPVDFTLEIQTTESTASIEIAHSQKKYRTEIDRPVSEQFLRNAQLEISITENNYNLLFISCISKSVCGQPFQDVAHRLN